MSKSNEQLSDELLARYIAHSATREEIEMVENWLQQSPDRNNELEHYQLLWDRSAAMGKAVDPSKVDRGWAMMQQKMRRGAPSSESDVRPLNGSRERSRWYPIMALVVGLAAVLLLVFRLNFYQSEVPVEMLRVVTNSETEAVLMPDGSQIFLNHDSSLEYPKVWQGDHREVTLTGEAFFEVVPDVAHPFIIHTHNGEVKVLGTSFNVRATTTSPLRVDVITGKVQLKTAITSKVLEKGQGAEVHADTIQSLAANANMLGYKTQIYDFKASQLGEVVEQLRMGYHADVRLARTNLYDCRLTIRFEKEPLDTTLAIIAETLQLSLRKEGEVYWLEGPGCN